jgi:polyferredoxin
MDKMGYARGLVKYSTQNAMRNHWTRKETWAHVFRPRVLIYTSILGAICVAMLVSLALRTPFKVDVVRDRGVMARIVSGGMIENIYRLQIMNAAESDQHYKITATGLPGLHVAADQEPAYLVEATQARWVAIRVQLPYEAAPAGSHTIHFEIVSEETGAQVREKSVFLVPR